MIAIPAFNILENEKSIYNTRYFLFACYINLDQEFLYGHTICRLTGMMSILVRMFSIPAGVTYSPAAMICIPVGTSDNQI